jgi:NhaP-type Na+/H+ or K+/H+ antiporter
MSGLVPLAVLAVPLLAYYGSAAAGGNGFIGAFVSGTAFAAAHPSEAPAGREALKESGEEDPTVLLTESLSTILAFAVWAIFGAIAVPHLWQHLTWGGVIFALLSLTLLRMVPVALALIGTRLTVRTVLFIGWFGPRGLASVVFALIAVQSLPPNDSLAVVLATVELTVLLSVVLHGATAGPWARRYGAWTRRVQPVVEMRT